MRPYSLFLPLWLVFNAAQGVKARKHRDNTNFKTKPGFELVNFHIRIMPNDTSILAPGYIFISNDMGPQIYDHFGNLVWFMEGRNNYKHQDLKPCPYHGEQRTHLCWHITSLSENHQNTAKDSRNVVYDESYTKVEDYSRGIIKGTGPNLHGFHMLPGGQTFLQPVYVVRPWDLRPYKGKKDGFIWDGCFQERHVATGKELFKWCAAEHFHLWETSVYFTTAGRTAPPGQKNTTSSKAGRGDKQFPFDFFHINAIDKNSENDYLVSSRHFDQIIKIAGPDSASGLKPGSIIWRLGGYGNDFKMRKFSFHKQHAIRYVSTDSAETVISLFDNEWEGSAKPHRKFSSGQIIKLNNETMEAELLNEYPHPSNRLSGSQGDMQLLPNGNTFIGWGRVPELSEFDHNGTCIYHINFRTNQYNPRSYRAFKDLWIGKPSTSPKLLAYAKNCKESSPLVAYVSWNGATEVRSWKFYVATKDSGPWIPAGSVAKDGFETEFVLSKRKFLSPFMPYVTVEALDADGALLGSAVSKTWVPGSNHKNHCDQKGCYHGDHFDYKAKLNHAQKCQPRDFAALIAVAVLVLFVEALSYSYRTITIWTLEKLQHKYQRISPGDEEPSMLQNIKLGQSNGYHNG